MNKTIPRKVKSANVVIAKSDSDNDNEEVSSTSLDLKLEEIPNGEGGSESHSISKEVVGESIKCEETVEAFEDKYVDDFKIPARTLPSYNVPEKIVIVYDSAVDEISTGFSINNESICPQVMLKRSIRFFLHNKQMIDPRHEYALAAMTDNSIVWLQDFTRDISDVIDALDDVPECKAEDILHLDDLFVHIARQVQLPTERENMSVPPPFVLRVLFTYGRSFTMPEVDLKLEAVLSLVKSPYFTFDILMTHEMPSSRNNCIKIFKYLQLIDCKGFAYFFPVGRSAAELHFSMAKLLAHPLQRACQRAAEYTINAMET